VCPLQPLHLVNRQGSRPCNHRGGQLSSRHLDLRQHLL
jgi:hypothetical protein